MKMLTESTCKKSWANLSLCVGNTTETQVFKQLIKEHFELVEHAKKLQDEVDKYKHEYFSMCDLVENPQPYKFEELKVGIWVWDKKYKVTNKIEELYKFGKQKAIRFSYLNEITQFGRTIEYEEDRFFPVTKALEYQK